ncbi:MAG: RES family NAD+ phosphorylase [Verrucomicrobiota bacterium]
MRLRPNPFYRRARKALRENQILAKPWSGVVFRSVPLEFAKPEQIVDGIGAMKTGARWNPPGSIRALYCSLNPGTAAEESMRLFEAAGLNRATVKPRLIVGIRYRLEAVIDLNGFLALIHGADLSELLAEKWQKINAQGRETQGQALGRALFNARVEGLLAPSARVPGANNLVVFSQSLRSASLQQVLESRELKIRLK